MDVPAIPQQSLAGPNGRDLDNITDSVTGYINFCMENTRISTRKSASQETKRNSRLVGDVG